MIHFDRQLAAIIRWCQKRECQIFIPLKGPVQIWRK